MEHATVPQDWPKDRPLAVSVSVMLEGWAAPDAPGMGPMGNILRAGTVDLQGRSWAEYGAKAGAWRLLDLLDQQETKAVFYTSGVVAERYPALPAAIVKRGHSVSAHGWSQGTLPAYLTPDQEAADIARCVDVIKATAGSAPAGWLFNLSFRASSSWKQTTRKCSMHRRRASKSATAGSPQASELQKIP